MKTQNPLLYRTSHIPFDAVSAECVVPAIDALLLEARQELDTIKNSTNTRTFENTLLALDNLGLNLNYAMSVVGHLESVATTPELRAAYNEILPKVTDFHSALTLDANLWRALRSYESSSEAKTLTGARKRFLDTTMASFRRSGADLPPEKKESLAKINSELSTVTNTFSQNTLDATNAFEYVTTSIDELKGLPESALAMGRASARSKNLEGWRYTLQAPSYIAIMTYAENQALRKRFYRAYNSRCADDPFDNVKHLYRILELRQQKAEILGYKDFADLVIADRMAKTGDTASSFVNTLRVRVENFFEREKRELEEFFVSSTGSPSSALQPWDVAFYAEKMRKANYDFDEEELRPYFPLPKVIQGMFDLMGRVFALKVIPAPSLPTWDKDVTPHAIHDEQTNHLLGYFYADLFPRENKRGGAWMNSFITHIPADGSEMPHVGLIAGNFTPPNGKCPSLLTHDEVTTLFHEFGHLIHHLCGTAEIRGQSMNGVAWDFIELPSQILENWCWDRASLEMIAGHYETGAPIPDALFEKMTRARNFRSASHLMRQLGFSRVDFALHREYKECRDGEILGFAREILNSFSTLPLPNDSAMIATFTHLFSSPVGYASGYYSYQWAEVLDADAFSRFERDGLMNRATGLDFRSTILATGDSEDPALLFERFMGRAPDVSALLRRAGLQE
jgi:oligopeptidase A